MKTPSNQILLLIFLGFGFVSIGAADSPDYQDQFRPGVVIFKVIPSWKVDLPETGSSHFGNVKIDLIIDEIDASKVARTYPSIPIPDLGKTDLTRIYTMHFPASVPVDKVCSDLKILKGIEYAEPWYIQKILLEHNDPEREDQWGLDIVQANEAHDITRGDPSIVIAIVDLGMDMDHPDMEDNQWINPGEDLNRNGRIDNNENNDRDDDDNGKTDDFYGWDFVDNDNNPEDTTPAQFGGGHGTHTAGIASAVTNNETGVASVGYSCSIMVVRVGDRQGIAYAYPGIIYAARTGAQVISCSFGGEQPSAQGRDAVNYAYEQGAVVLAAGGNENENLRIYPACFDHVVAVAATDSRDRKWDQGNLGSNFGDWIDISAPGQDILSCILRGRYGNKTGTSMACPFAASVVALILSINPDLSVEETLEILYEGADNIDEENPDYEGELGAGRINALNSVRLVGDRPDLFLGELEIIDDDNHNGRLDPGEEVQLTVNISRGFDEADLMWINVTLMTDDPAIDIINGAVEFPIIEVGQDSSNQNNPFVISVDEDAVPHTISFNVSVSSEPRRNLERSYEFLIGTPGILVMDDDGGSSNEEWYLSLIEDLGFGWETWDNYARVILPEVELLEEREMIIWLTGDSDPPLDNLERDLLTDALAEGANILLIGKRIGDYDENHDFLESYFGAQHDEDSVEAWTVTGVEGSPLDEDVMIFLDEGGIEDATSTPSTMEPVNDASVLVEYQLDRILGTAGVYRIDGETGSKTVYLGFSLEGIYSGGEAGTPPSEVLNSLHDWFTNVQSTPLKSVKTPSMIILDPAYPNPFNSMVEIGYTLTATGYCKLVIVDAIGREVSVLNDGFARQGYYHTTWNAAGLPSGTYFARLIIQDMKPINRQLILLK